MTEARPTINFIQPKTTKYYKNKWDKKKRLTIQQYHQCLTYVADMGVEKTVQLMKMLQEKGLGFNIR